MINITSILAASAIPFVLLGAAAQSENADTANGEPEVAVEGAVADDPDGNAEASAEEPLPERKKMRCKMTKVVNSRIPTRICATNEAWEEKEREMREQKQGTLNRNSGCTGTPC